MVLLGGSIFKVGSPNERKGGLDKVKLVHIERETVSLDDGSRHTRGGQSMAAMCPQLLHGRPKMTFPLSHLCPRPRGFSKIRKIP